MLEKLFEFTKNGVVYDVFYNDVTGSLQVTNPIKADKPISDEETFQLADEVTEAFFKDKSYKRIKRKMEQAAAQ